MKYQLFCIIFLIILVEACAQACIKKYHQDKDSLYMCIGMLMYLLVASLLYLSYNYCGIGLVNALWSAASVILMICIGTYLYHEHITILDIIGLILIIIGIFLIFVMEHY